MNSVHKTLSPGEMGDTEGTTVQLFYMQTKLVKMGNSPIIQFDVFLRLAMAPAQTNMRTL